MIMAWQGWLLFFGVSIGVGLLCYILYGGISGDGKNQDRKTMVFHCIGCGECIRTGECVFKKKTSKNDSDT